MEFDKIPNPDNRELPTKFTYHLMNDTGVKAAEMGLENVRLNAAQTMLFCPTVRSIEIIDEINGRNFKITRSVNSDKDDSGVTETTFIEESAESSTPHLRKFVSINVEEPSKELSHYWHESRNLRLHIGVEVDQNDNIIPIPSTSPSIYCSLPLIGFEKMLLPFYINSNDFEPATERTSLYLYKKETRMVYNQEKNEDEEQVIQNGVNWSILRRSASLYETLVDYLIEHGYNNRYNLVRGLSKTLKDSWSDEEKNCLAARFILPLRSMLVGKKLVNTIDGYRCISDGIKFLECSKDLDATALYQICSRIYRNDMPIESENQNWIEQKWGRYQFPLSDFDEKRPDKENPIFPKIDYTDIAKYIEDAESIEKLVLVDDTDKLHWLNQFYLWIANAKLSTIADKAIVPNRKGHFCICKPGDSLKDANDIASSIFDFMKKLDIDWDEKLLMEGVENVVLEKESTDNIVTEIKERTKAIIDSKNEVLTKLLPLLLAIPENSEDGRVADFYKKRCKIISILRTVYYSHTKDLETTTLGLKSETWKNADDWFMDSAAHEIAKRGKLDVHTEDMDEDEIAENYCTKEWLSDTLIFMFEKGYLHLDDITETSDASTNTLKIIPNRYGDFDYKNKLYNQGSIPSELLDDCLKSTGFDIKEVLLCDGFVLSEKILLTDYSITSLAKTYNDYFEDEDGSDKESVANYLLHLVPECGDQYEEICKLYDEYNGTTDAIKSTIDTSDLTIWKGAKNFIVNLLAAKVDDCQNLCDLGKVLRKDIEDGNAANFSDSDCTNVGLSWLNRLVVIVKAESPKVFEEYSLIPDWNGNLRLKEGMLYDGSVLNNYKKVQNIIDIEESELWNYYKGDNQDEGDETVVSSIVYPEFVQVGDFQNNTDENLFRIVDNLVSYCSENNDTSWRDLLKKNIATLLSFFDANEDPLSKYAPSKKPAWAQYFANTYKTRKELYYDYICDAETKARISRINDNFTPDEIENLIKEKEAVKDILNKRDYYEGLAKENQALQEKVEELSNVHSLLESCPEDKVDFIKNLIKRLADGGLPIKDGEIPVSGNDTTEVVVVPQVHEVEVEGFDGKLQVVRTDQIQYAGLSLEEIEKYVSEAKGAVVKYFRELDERNHLGLQFDNERIAKHSYSQLYGISDRNGNEIPIVVHSYKGPQYRYFDLNWYDWHMLSRENSMLFVLTVTGLQCIPLYALPVRNFQFKIENTISNIERTALLTLAEVGKKYSSVSFDFGNNMPHGFKDPLPFDYVPEGLEACISAIKETCDKHIPQIANIYNSGKSIPLVRSDVGYSLALQEIEAGKARDIFDAPLNEIKAPEVGTSFID
jgi:hypothetical protein